MSILLFLLHFYQHIFDLFSVTIIIIIIKIHIFCPKLFQEFDSTYGPAWHCIVGTSFGSYVTHSIGGFLYFSIDKVYVLLFRTAVEPLNHWQYTSWFNFYFVISGEKIIIYERFLFIFYVGLYNQQIFFHATIEIVLKYLLFLTS